jgi:hypothetical protein
MQEQIPQNISYRGNTIITVLRIIDEDNVEVLKRVLEVTVLDGVMYAKYRGLHCRVSVIESLLAIIERAGE